jgi:hypothetical protein
MFEVKGRGQRRGFVRGLVGLAVGKFRVELANRKGGGRTLKAAMTVHVDFHSFRFPD